MKSINTPATRIKPFSVTINWSESSQFKDGELYNFMVFERKALEVAKTNPLGGYDKTNVTVTFENGDEHQCRLDLGCGCNDIGFAEHCISLIEYDEEHKDEPDFVYRFDLQHHQQLVQLIKTYQLDSHFVIEARSQVKQAMDEAKQREHEQQQAEAAKRRQQWLEYQVKEEAFRQTLDIPEQVKAVIVATYSVYDEE